jgi:hypothetical protein
MKHALQAEDEYSNDSDDSYVEKQ